MKTEVRTDSSAFQETLHFFPHMKTLTQRHLAESRRERNFW